LVSCCCMASNFLDIFSKSSSILASLELELQNLMGLLVACRFLLRRPAHPLTVERL
jgi:hypothetical protein